MPKRLLFVDDEPGIRVTLAAILSKHGFEVSTAATVPEALLKITSETFDALLSDLNIGNPGDGLTVVSAMRRTQPNAVTMILTGYPAFESALEAIRQQVDEYVVKPADIPFLVRAIENKLAAPHRSKGMPPTKRVAMILQENLERIQELWLSAVEQDKELSHVTPSREYRIKDLEFVMKEVIREAQSYGPEHREPDCSSMPTHTQHIHPEGETPLDVVGQLCHLRSALAQVVQENLLSANLSFLVSDLALVNRAIDEQAKARLKSVLSYSA